MLSWRINKTLDSEELKFLKGGLVRTIESGDEYLRARVEDAIYETCFEIYRKILRHIRNYRNYCRMEGIGVDKIEIALAEWEIEDLVESCLDREIAYENVRNLAVTQ